jgi:hypothetical protein
VKLVGLITQLRTRDFLGVVTVVCFLGALLADASAADLLPLLAFGWACAAGVFVLEERDRGR